MAELPACEALTVSFNSNNSDLLR